MRAALFEYDALVAYYPGPSLLCSADVEGGKLRSCPNCGSPRRKYNLNRMHENVGFQTDLHWQNYVLHGISLGYKFQP